MSQPPFAAAIFDMDGLLLDSERKIMRAWVKAAQALNVDLTEESFLPVIGLNMQESNELLEHLLGGASQFAQVRRHAVHLLREGSQQIHYPIKADASDFVNRVRQRQINCAVASSTPIGEVKRRLRAVDLHHQFAHFAGGDEVERGKPDPAVYLLAAQRLGLEPHRCLAFEDSENGIRAALAAGMPVVIIPDLKTPSTELLGQAFHSAESLSACQSQLSHWFAKPDTI